MKFLKVLFIIFILYISAYSRDILQYHHIMNDRNIDLPLESISISENSNEINIDNQILLNNEFDRIRKLINEGKFFEVINICNELENMYTNYYELYYYRGLSYFRRGDLSYAAFDFNKLLLLNINKTDYDKVYGLIIDFFDTINEYEETVRAAIIAYKVTNNLYWLFLAGNSSLKNGDIKSADYYFNLCLKESPSYANEGLGDLNLLSNNFDEALKRYKMVKYSNSEEITRIQTKISNTIVKKEIYDWNERLSEKDYNASISILNNISSYSKDFPEIKAALGKTYFSMGDYKNAKNMLTKLISVEKDFDEAYAILAQIYLYENNETEAVKILEKGLEYSYNKPRLYETFASMLYEAGYSYYPDKIISQLINLYNISDENKIDYSRSLIRNKKYDEASKLLNTVAMYKDTAGKLLKSIEYNKILDKAEELKEKNYYVDLMHLLSSYQFIGNEEQLRIGYIADAYEKLGSIDKAIDILKEAYNTNTISVNNILLLRKLLGIRASDNDTSAYQKEKDLIDIKATEYWEEELKLNLNLVTDRIFEFIKFNQFDEALAYISDLRNKNYDIAYIKKIESAVYGLYAAYLYENKKYDEAYKTAALAVRRNRNNYDAIAIKNEMDIDSYLSSIGYYNNTDAYVNLSSIMREILRISPVYIDNRIKLAEAYIREYNIEGFTIINKISEYINIKGGRDLLLGREYNKAYLYSYSLSSYDRASKYLYVDPLYKADTLINMDNYTKASENLDKLNSENIKDPNVLYAISKLYLKIGNYNEAINVINNAIFIDNNIDYIYQRSYINELMGNTKEALSGYENIIKLKKNYSAANYRAAVINLENFKNDIDAELYALNYLALLPDDYSGYELLGKIYKIRAEKYIDRNTNNLLKESLSNYETALSKAVWGRDANARNSIEIEIKYIQNKILE